MAKRLVIFGAGDIASIAKFYFTHDSAHEVAGFTVDGAFLKEQSFEGLPVVAFEEAARAFPPDAHDGFVAVSYAKLNELRAEKFAAMADAGYAMASYVSSKATTWPGLAVGRNCFILEDNTIQPFVTIADGVTLWSGNHVGHHATIGAFSFIASHVVISGGVTIGEKCFIGVNVTIRDHVTIGAKSVLGAGAILLADAPEASVYAAAATERSPVPSTRLRRI